MKILISVLLGVVATITALLFWACCMVGGQADDWMEEHFRREEEADEICPGLEEPHDDFYSGNGRPPRNRPR